MKKKFGIFIVIATVAMMFNTIFPVLNIGNNDKAIAADSTSSSLKILEIKPDYKDSYELNYLRGKKIDNRDVELIQMTLNQFNSMRNDVNGEIDIIYFSKGRYGLVYGDRDPQPPRYGDRIDPYGSGGNYAPRRYNDITNLRANKIIEMIESGQLVYINSGAFSDGDQIYIRIYIDIEIVGTTLILKR